MPASAATSSPCWSRASRPEAPSRSRSGSSARSPSRSRSRVGRAVQASIGIALGVGGPDGDEIMRNADLAMYRAKGEGKGAYALYEPCMHARVLERLELKADLQRAVDRGRVRRALPADRHAADRRHRRRRGARALAAPRARARASGRVHPARRGDRAHPPARQSGAAAGMPQARDLAQARPPALGIEREHLREAAAEQESRRSR